MDCGDENDWVFAEAEDDGEDAFNGGWVLAGGDNDDDGWRRAIGVFFLSPSSGLVFSPFASAAPVPSLDFLPSSAVPCCSAGGLLVLRCAWSTYYVVNPSTSEYVKLGRPPTAFRGPRSAIPAESLALVLHPSSDNYYVVAAAGDSFYVYSSVTTRWTVSESEILGTRLVVLGSSVSAGGVAYWRADDGYVIGFDPVTAVATLIDSPLRDPAQLWQLGECAGRLCCAIVAGPVVELIMLEDSGKWVPRGSVDVVGEEVPRPIRFEGEDLEVVLITGSTLVAANIDNGRRRVAALGDFTTAAALVAEDYVPYTKTLAPARPGYNG